MSDLSTIAAISTAPGVAALAVVRVSGPAAHGIADRLGLPGANARMAVHSRLVHPSSGETVDDVVAIRYAGPSSFTGEDMLEISCHGGALIPQLVLEAACEAGARPAEPGEFTRRAFLNGKLDLTQVEAILDLIEARSPAMHRAAVYQLARGLASRIALLRDGLVELQGLLAYDIDFPEEDDGPVPEERIREAAGQRLSELDALLALAPEGELLRDGALTVIAGRPNAGKSSLFNALVGFERAIVTEEPGTTRDAIEAVIGVEGYPFRLVDTAGLRENTGRVEELGIEVARGYLASADLVLLCVDAEQEPGPEEEGFIAGLGAAAPHVIIVRTKADRCGATGPRGHLGSAQQLPVSAHTGAGVAELRKTLLERAFAGILGRREMPVVTRARHVKCLERARDDLLAFQEALRKGLPAEISGTHVQDATLALEEMLGAVTHEDVLDRVFSSFCVGK